MFAKTKLPVILFGAAQLLKWAARRNPDFKARLKEHNFGRPDHDPRRGDRALDCFQ